MTSVQATIGTVAVIAILGLLTYLVANYVWGFIILFGIAVGGMVALIWGTLKTWS